MELFGMKSWYQLNMYLCMYVGYMLYIFNRKSFTFMIPNIVEKDGIDINSIGIILSSNAAAYAVGKFVSGILVDKYSPRIMFATGLFITGVSNLLFSVSPLSLFALLWFLNGLAQGPGWPSCGKILRRWYSPITFGTLWSTLGTSMNVPASAGPLLCSMFIAWNGGLWRPVMLICGTVSCGFAFLTLFIITDKPEDVGLTLQMLTSDEKSKNAEETKSSKKETPKSTLAKKSKQNTWKRIFSSPYTYVISQGFLVSLYVRGVLVNWSALYLIQEKGGNQYLSGVFLAWLEFGGVCGSIFSGYVSDKLVSWMSGKSKGSPRHILYVTWYLIILLCVFMLRTMVHDIDSQQTFTFLLGFLIGFGAYGNISLSGVLAIENSANDISGTTHALCSLFGNFGVMLSGLPFSMLMESLSWNGALQTCEICLVCSAFIFIVAQWFSCRIGDLVKED